MFHDFATHGCGDGADDAAKPTGLTNAGHVIQDSTAHSLPVELCSLPMGMEKNGQLSKALAALPDSLKPTNYKVPCSK